MTPSRRRPLRAVQPAGLDLVDEWVAKADLRQLECRAGQHHWSRRGGTVKETPAGWHEEVPCVNGCGNKRVRTVGYDGNLVGKPHIAYDPDYLLPRGSGLAGRSKAGRAAFRRAYYTTVYGAPVVRRTS